MLNTRKMRDCAPLLPHPGSEVVISLIDEIDRLRLVLTQISSIQNKYIGDEIELARSIAREVLHGTPEQKEEALKYCSK